MVSVKIQPENARVNTGFAVLISLAAALGGFLFGYDSAVINGAVPGIQQTFNATSAQLGIQVASLLLGAALGALIAGRLAERWGRRYTMLVAGILFLVSAGSAALAPTSVLFTSLRFFSGIGLGLASSVTPIYIAEVAPTTMRGRLLSLNSMALVIGIFIGFLVDYSIALAAGAPTSPFWFGLDAWRCMLLTEVIPAAIYVIGALLIPETPRRLVASGQVEKAAAVLDRLQPGASQQQITEIRRTLATEHKSSFRDLLGPAGRILPIVWIGIVLAALQQLVGINVIFYYGSALWQSVGVPPDNALLINVINSSVNILGTTVAILLIDRIGRRPLLLTGSIGMTIALLTMVLMFRSGTVNAEGLLVLPQAQGIIALLAANVFVFMFALSWGPVVWTLLGEMFNNKIRAAAIAVAVMANWLANWLVTVTFPSLLMVGPSFTYAFYALFAAISIYFTVRYIQETRGRALEQM